MRSSVSTPPASAAASSIFLKLSSIPYSWGLGIQSAKEWRSAYRGSGSVRNSETVTDLILVGEKIRAGDEKRGRPQEPGGRREDRTESTGTPDLE
jgi:hypothetical protein